MWRELQPDDPARIGPYRLSGVLGSGGMGRVFLGASADGQLAAVKVIRAELATDPEFRARFRREVTVARKVGGRFTVPLIGADVDGPVPWLATAYVAGPSLADVVAEHGPLPARSVLELAAGLAEGLTAIHAAGVIHRDLKPSNVLLAQDGPRVIDFGISVAAETAPLTRTGLLIGSPGYMSPEHVEGRPVGPASDIFSLGAVLAFAAAGQAPFGSGLARREASLDRVPAEVRGLILRCLARDPGQRPTARNLMFAAVTRTRSDPQQVGDSSRTVTSARLIPAARPAFPPAAGRPRRLARPLTIIAMVAGLLAASAAGGIALAASVHPSPASHPRQTVSGQAVPGPASSPVTSAPPTTFAPPASSAPPAPSTSPVMTTSPATTATPVATPSMTTSPAASPAASSSASAPAPAGSAVPAPAAS